MIRYSRDGESITLDYPVEREDEVLDLAARTFCPAWTAQTQGRWLELLGDDEKRRKDRR